LRIDGRRAGRTARVLRFVHHRIKKKVRPLVDLIACYGWGILECCHIRKDWNFLYGLWLNVNHAETRYAFRVFRGVVEASAPQPSKEIFAVPFVDPAQAEWEYFSKIKAEQDLEEQRRHSRAAIGEG
jgi:hypothetical protein